MTRPAPEPQRAEEVEPLEEQPLVRRVVTAGQERTVRIDDVDDVIGVAAELRQQDEARLTVDELEEVAVELGIEERYVERAIETLKTRRAEEKRRTEQARLARTRRLRYGLILGGTVLVVLGVASYAGQASLRGQLSEVQRTRAQVRNVTERQQAVQQRHRDSSPSPDRDAELAGAENRVRIERARYDKAAATYNASAGGPFASLYAPLFGLPTSVPLSNEVASW